MLLSRLRSVSRRAHLSIDVDKQAVTKKKLAVDATFLALQNLRYERGHLLREIARCVDFPTIEADKLRDELVSKEGESRVPGWRRRVKRPADGRWK